METASRDYVTYFLLAHVALSAVIPSSVQGNTSSLPARDIPFFPLIPDVPAGWVLNDLDSVPECSSDDPENPSQECFQALDVRAQGYMWINTKTCTTPQNQALTRAFRHAYTIIAASEDFPTKESHQQAAAYYMGPDWETEEYKNRLTCTLIDVDETHFKHVLMFRSANVKRAVTFHSDTVNNYVTISCNDPRKQCAKKFNKKFVGGYAWVKKHWLWWDWHYINMCDIFFTSVEEFDKRLRDIRDNVADGNYQFADDASWLQTTGSYLLHEMMHTRIIDNSPPDPHSKWSLELKRRGLPN
ncbi:MAG: hypothetical protein CL912_00790 [Deltaproteobacteria bacterium]|nr:hypothetical protein [Deltaproteobacteria bacterium]